MARRDRSPEVEAALLRAVAEHPHDLVSMVAAQLGLSRQRITLQVRELVAGGYLEKVGTTRPRYALGPNRRLSRRYPRAGLAEDAIWFDHDARYDADLLDDAEDCDGTTVVMEIAADSPRTARSVIDQYSSGPEDYSFARTVVPVRLAKVGDESLVSRSQAKRLLQRIDRFRSVVLDFAEVSTIGQAFADEIFRVFANAHPEVELIPIHALPEVQQMIRRAEVLRDEEGGQLPLLK